MEQATVDNNLKNIERMVVDEGKVVTYKGLSRSLGIHVNTAKQLLHTFVSHAEKNYGDKISSTYQVSGKKDDGCMFLSVITESQLPLVRASLVDIFSEHVYSVQPGSNLADFQLLFTVDTTEELSSLTSPILCSDSIVKEGHNIEYAAVKEAVFVKTKNEAKPAKTKPVFANNKEADKKVEEEAVKEVTKNISNVKIEQPNVKAAGKKGSITSMFSAQTSKAKTAQKKEDMPKKNEDVAIQKKEEKVVKTDREESNKDDVKETDSGKKSEAKALKKVEKKSEKPKSKTKKKNNAEEDQNEKKRKRIRVFSDSEDSETEEPVRERSLSPEPLEPEPEVKIESEPEIVEETSLGTSTHKRKKRKIVDKLVMTEEGYMETTKEVLLETDSEAEDVVIKKPNKIEKAGPSKASPETKSSEEKKAKSSEKSSPEAKTAGGKKTTPKQSASPKKGKGKPSNDGKKQATLFSFFKKT